MSSDAAMSDAPNGGASPAPDAASTTAAAAAADSSAAAAAPAAAGASSSSSRSKKGKSKKEEVVEVDPNFEGQKYHIGELIYANYAEGKQWFEAKVLKVEKRQGRIYYYLHYNGWGEKYQDWRPYHNDNELHKHDEEGKRIADEAKQRMKEASKKGSKSSAAAASAAEPAKGRGKKRRAEDGEDAIEDEVSVGGGAAGEVKLKISGALKKQLILDWESVTRNKKLVSLPRSTSVRALLAEFEESKAKQESSHQMTKEVVAGVEAYFEKALGKLLLYRFERPQYVAHLAKAQAAGKSMSEVYGAEHLLRLFVKLPSLLSASKLDPREAIVLGSKLNDFLKFLDKKAQTNTLFQQEYEATDQEYVQKAQAADTEA